jgi:hypothetical protein
MDWGFYGRAEELRAVTQIVSRNRWYFAKMTGRRRIGKTPLIQKAIQTAGQRRLPHGYGRAGAVRGANLGPGALTPVDTRFQTIANASGH